MTLLFSIASFIWPLSTHASAYHHMYNSICEQFNDIWTLVLRAPVSIQGSYRTAFLTRAFTARACNLVWTYIVILVSVTRVSHPQGAHPGQNVGYSPLDSCACMYTEWLSLYSIEPKSEEPAHLHYFWGSIKNRPPKHRTCKHEGN